MANFSEIPLFLDPIELDKKDIVLLAVNDASDPSAPGGSHWSLLIFSKQAKEFFHFDSSPGSNAHDARALARKMHEYFKTKIGDFGFVMIDVPVLKQTNGYDCGIHLLCNAEHATRHIWLLGSHVGLKDIDPNFVKRKRAEIRKLILSMAGRDLDNS